MVKVAKSYKTVGHKTYPPGLLGRHTGLTSVVCDADVVSTVSAEILSTEDLRGL
jgi:hypothetical protein